MTASSFGLGRERAVKARLESQGWFVIRAAASLGYADLVALRRVQTGWDDVAHVFTYACEAWMIEVKGSARGPWEHFRRPERRALRNAAEKAGAVPVLAWWPKYGTLRFLMAEDWPADDTLVPNDDELPVGGSSACAAVGGEV